MEAVERNDPPTLVFDNFDIDIIVKVLTHTVFSPTFLFLVPLFFRAQGESLTSTSVLLSTAWLVLAGGFWLVKWLSRLYRNGRSPFAATPTSRFDWGEQIVVITGGASGIGELLANTLAVRNVSVAVLDVKPIVTENDNVYYYKCDVSKWEEVEAAAKKIVEEIGHPTVLVNNAGVVQGKLVLDLTPEDVNQTFGVNVISHFWTLKAFLPEMIKEKTGHIITMSSVIGLTGVAQMSDYTASKAALVSLSDSLRYELDKRYKTPDIRTTLVLPGYVHTQLFSQISYPSSNLHKFLIPTIPPITVVKEIIKAMDSQESRTIYLPFYANFVRLTVLMPSFIRDFFQNLSYADYAMEGFVKKSGRRPDDAPIPPTNTISPSNKKAD